MPTSWRRWGSSAGPAGLPSAAPTGGRWGRGPRWRQRDRREFLWRIGYLPERKQTETRWRGACARRARMAQAIAWLEAEAHGEGTPDLTGPERGAYTIPG